MDLNKIKQEVTSLIKEVGIFLVENQKKIKDIQIKKDESPVTNLDKKAEKMIFEALKKYNFNFLGEEFGFVENNSEYFWVVDPLDGTRGYISQEKHYAVSIALLHKNKPILGLVYLPRFKRLYSAIKNKCAYLNDKKIKVSTRDYHKTRLLVSISNYNKIKEVIDCLDLPKTFITSGAGRLCLIAEGKSEAYFYKNHSWWDIAAAKLILEEAGGKITDLEGKTIKFDREKPQIDYVVATNGQIHQQFIGELKKIIARSK